MSTAFAITLELRMKLKDPFGDLIQGDSFETICKMKELVEKEKPSRIISVGDIISRSLHKNKINPQLTIIDNISQRKPLTPKEIAVEKTVYINNPQGTITNEAVIAVKGALETNEHTHIVVNGEEDLLTLVAVLYAPQNAIVVYGQPNLGIVVVRVTSEKKAQAQEYLKAMKT